MFPKNLLAFLAFLAVLQSGYSQGPILEFPIGDFLKNVDPFMILPDFVFHLDRILGDTGLVSGSVEIGDLWFRGLSSLVLSMYTVDGSEDQMEIRITGSNITFDIDTYRIKIVAAELINLGFGGSVKSGFDKFDFRVVGSQDPATNRITLTSVNFPIQNFKIDATGIIIDGNDMSKVVSFGVTTLAQQLYKQVMTKEVELSVFEKLFNAILYLINNAK